MSGQKSEADKREAHRKQYYHSRQAGHYQELAAKATSIEERESLLEQARREHEKADYWEAEAMD